MTFIKIEYGSPQNVSVRGTEYFEIHADDLDDDGCIPEELIDNVWQDAVNEFMGDTSASIVENEGD